MPRGVWVRFPSPALKNDSAFQLSHFCFQLSLKTDEYEKYVDSYLKFYKKAMAGDANAMTEYADYLQRTQKLTEKFYAIEKELTPKQYSRFMELQTKMVTGLSDM